MKIYKQASSLYINNILLVYFIPELWKYQEKVLHAAGLLVAWTSLLNMNIVWKYLLWPWNGFHSELETDRRRRRRRCLVYLCVCMPLGGGSLLGVSYSVIDPMGRSVESLTSVDEAWSSTRVSSTLNTRFYWGSMWELTADAAFDQLVFCCWAKHTTPLIHTSQESRCYDKPRFTLGLVCWRPSCSSICQIVLNIVFILSSNNGTDHLTGPEIRLSFLFAQNTCFDRFRL